MWFGFSSQGVPAIPTYFYKCTDAECENVREDDAKMSEYEGHHPPCTECGKVCNYVWIPTVPQVAFKDGPSGGWPSKAEHFKNYRAKRSEEMVKRQKDRYGHLKPDAIPNYNGKETGTWQEAQFQALKEKGAESAATFVPKVEAEKAADKTIKIKT